MRKKTRVVISSLAVFSLLLILSIPVLAQSKTGSFMSKWGKTLKEYSIADKEKESKIYAKGNSATITNDDVQQATDFYILSGMDSGEAREKAINYIMEREALYEEAIRNGFTVTDAEVRDYLKELKKTINNADNKEDVYAVIDAYGSEKEYWDYEFTVYQKDLPIQKYKDSLKTQFKTRPVKGNGAVDVTNDFRSYFEEYKQELVKDENYQVVE